MGRFRFGALRVPPARAGRAAIYDEYRFRKHNGEYCWYWGQAVPLRSDAGEIIESITDAFFAVDRNWRFTYVNREAEQLLQRPRAQLLGCIVWEEFPEAAGAKFEREYRRAVDEH